MQRNMQNKRKGNSIERNNEASHNTNTSQNTSVTLTRGVFLIWFKVFLRDLHQGSLLGIFVKGLC